MYHEVPDAGDGAPYFAVPRAAFAEQLDLLAARGRRAVALEAAADDPSAGQVAITFDDGHVTHWSNAFPELAQRGMTATFFVVAGWVGRPGYASWAELREMARAGMSIQSHTSSHPFLSELASSAARAELVESRRLIDAELGQRTTTLALPNGDGPRGWTAADFADAGYRLVATSRWGANVGGSAAATTRLVRRYTVRRASTLEDVRWMVESLPGTASVEGVRQGALGTVRRMLGPTRYARWRRSILDRLSRGG